MENNERLLKTALANLVIAIEEWRKSGDYKAILAALSEAKDTLATVEGYQP